MKTAFQLIEEHGLTLHGDIEHFAELVRADECSLCLAETEAMERQANILTDALAESRREIDAMIALARADEREACAKVCEEYETNNDITATWLNIVAEAIRARSNT